MFGLILTLAIIAIIAAICSQTMKAERETREEEERRAEQKAESSSAPALAVRSDDEVQYYCRIAGLSCHCTAQDFGGFLGYILPDLDNEYNKDACAIMRNDWKILGYIPESELKGYRGWSGAKPMPCVGYVREGDEAPMYGRVKAINAGEPNRTLLIAEYVRWMVSKFGADFVPKGFEVTSGANPQTKEEWLEVLDDYIGEEE